MTRHSLPACLALAVCAAAVLLLLALHPSPAGAQQSGVGACPATMPGGSEVLVCRCSAVQSGASVWGTDIYTDDSNLCSAAAHAGAIPATGGIISVQALPGRDYYSGSQRNGIASRDYGQWRRSIGFEGAQSVADGVDNTPLCPGTYNANGTGWSGTCRCAAGADGGAVWGSGAYTADSNLCRAARHAGVIGAGGGIVRVTAAAGQNSYAGSTRNGITTSSWGSYGASFRVSN